MEADYKPVTEHEANTSKLPTRLEKSGPQKAEDRNGTQNGLQIAKSELRPPSALPCPDVGVKWF
jgi:hypothetical protein